MYLICFLSEGCGQPDICIGFRHSVFGLYVGVVMTFSLALPLRYFVSSDSFAMFWLFIRWKADFRGIFMVDLLLEMSFGSD